MENFLAVAADLGDLGDTEDDLGDRGLYLACLLFHLCAATPDYM